MHMDWKKVLEDLAGAGYTQVRLAEQCACSQSTISAIARGETKDPAHSIGEVLKALHTASQIRRVSQQAA